HERGGVLVEKSSQHLRTDPTHAPPPISRRRTTSTDATAGRFFQGPRIFLSESPGSPRGFDSVRFAVSSAPEARSRSDRNEHGGGPGVPRPWGGVYLSPSP